LWFHLTYLTYLTYLTWVLKKKSQSLTDFFHMSLWCGIRCETSQTPQPIISCFSGYLTFAKVLIPMIESTYGGDTEEIPENQKRRTPKQVRSFWVMIHSCAKILPPETWLMSPRCRCFRLN
jgi:hypothetical protein